MGLFSNILEKLGMGSPKVVPQPPAAAPAPSAAPAPAPAAAPAPAPVASITMVDVVALMEQKAAANPQKLNWKTSIVDLLKLLDLDSSLAARKELAKELYCPDDAQECVGPHRGQRRQHPQRTHRLILSMLG